MSEWHAHLGAPLKYEEEEPVTRYEGNPWAAPKTENKPVPKRISDAKLYHCFLERLKFAEAKHPVFAEGPYHGLAYVEEEVGELVKAVTKGESEDRIFDEALDVIVTAWRYARQDWKVKDSAQGATV